MTEKLNPIERALVAAAAMPAPKSRAILRLICEAGMRVTQDIPLPEQLTEGQKHYAKREKFIKRTKGACDRVLKYAKHETLRNVERHFRAVPHAIESADEPKTGLAARLTFKRSDFADELLAALREEAALALQAAGQQLFDELGSDNVWTMPGSVATDFLDARANLMANVPDEVHAEIMQSIQDGLDHGESRRELMARIASKFDEISTGRAETIANTETSAAFNYARDKAMREAGVTHKRWLHSQSPDIKEPRPTHVEADGQVVPIDEPFDVGGVKFMMPADGSLGAGPEDIINCHCVSIPVEAPVKSGEGEGHPFRGNQWTKITVFRGDRPNKTSFTGREDQSNYIQGNIFFSDKPTIGRFYTKFRTKYMISPEQLDESHGLYRANLHFNNPLIVDAKDSDWSEIPYKGKRIQIDDLASQARKLGYDGLIVKNVFDQAGHGTQFVAFHSHQIKRIPYTAVNPPIGY